MESLNSDSSFEIVSNNPSEFEDYPKVEKKNPLTKLFRKIVPKKDRPQPSEALRAKFLTFITFQKQPFKEDILLLQWWTRLLNLKLAAQKLKQFMT